MTNLENPKLHTGPKRHGTLLYLLEARLIYYGPSVDHPSAEMVEQAGTLSVPTSGHQYVKVRKGMKISVRMLP